MRLIMILFQLIFPSQYSLQEMRNIPSAPEPQHADIFALYDYQKEKGKKIIYAIKQKRDRYLEYLIAQEMSDHLLAEISERSQYSYFLEPVIISVPLHKKRLRERGFNQSTGIAKELAKLLHGHYRENLLYKNKQTQKQALITSRSERMQNTKGCFSINKKYSKYIKHKDVIIVDDLITTGATLLECKKVLLQNGARKIIAITVAH